MTVRRLASFRFTATMLEAVTLLPMPLVWRMIQSPSMLGASEVVCPSAIGCTTQVVSWESFFVFGIPEVAQRPAVHAGVDGDPPVVHA